MEIDSREIGKRILSSRNRLNLTQEALSEISGISVNQISNLENGHFTPSVKTVIRLCASLKVTPNYFLLGITDKIDDKAVNRIAELAIQSTEKQQQFIYEFITLLLKEDL